MKKTRKNRFKKTPRSPKKGAARRSGRLLATIAVMAAISGLFILAHDYFTQSEQFALRQVTVSGNQRLDREHLLAVAGIRPGMNILALNLAAARKRLLADPWVAAATVSRTIPSKLHLHIDEEAPLARVQIATGQAYLINLVGRVFKHAAPGEGGDLPRIEGLVAADLPVDQAKASAAFEAAMALLAVGQKPDSPVHRSKMAAIRVDHEIGLSVVMRPGGRIIKFGFGDYEAKADALEKILARLKRRQPQQAVGVIDLYDIGRIVVTATAATGAAPAHKEV